MDQNFSSTKAPTVATTYGGGKSGGAAFSNPDYIKVNDTLSATWSAVNPGDAAGVTGSGFAFPTLPSSAIVDGIMVSILGSVNRAYFGTGVSLNIPGTTAKALGALPNTYGSATDKWGASQITPAQIAALTVTADFGDVSGAQAYGAVQYMEVTVYWHVAAAVVAPADVPTRVDYKVYSRNKKYLGKLPNVKSVLSFPQDINTTGALLDISCGKDLRNVTQVDKLQTEDLLDIQTEDDLPILTESTELLVTNGNSPDDALFKNSNIVKAYLYNYWYPNGKLMFTGQVNRVSFSYGADTDYANLKVYSEGYDLSNYIARGYPFTPTTQVSQTSQNGTVTSADYSAGGKGAGWNIYGQTFVTGASQTNIAAITLQLTGVATVTLNIYDQANGNLLASVSKDVNAGIAVATTFELQSLLTVTPNTTYFFAVWVSNGQSINVGYSSTDVYSSGSLYNSSYSGGSGGGSFYAIAGDLYFVVYSGSPTTITTYTAQDPITSTFSKILLDYNNRGGKIKQRSFTAAGISVTYTFNLSTIMDAMKKVIDLSPYGYYAYVDLGTSEIDMKKMNTTTPDFKIVRGNELASLEIALTTEQVENDLLFTGGVPAGSTQNLFKEYKSTASAAYYGLRTKTASDNRVVLASTADALGTAFIAENADEQHETKIRISNKLIDITLLVPGKTIGFRNFGNFIDKLVLPIVRREYTPDYVDITLGRLPLALSDEVQSINRDLLNEQTYNNPAQPT